jgi:energy-coupling factor transporter ATP-binding protein EcfA2
VFRWFIYAPFIPSLKIIHQERTIDLLPYLLIIGPPQAGKTTLANIMQGLYLDENDLEEAYRSIGPDGFKTPPRIAKQLSYTNFPLIVNEFYTYGMRNKYEIYENLKASFSLHFRLLGFRDKEESDYSLRAICFTANRLDYIPDKALYRRLYTIHLSTMSEIPKEKKEEFAKFIRNLYLKPLGNLAIWMVLDEPELLECNFIEFGDIFLRKIERFDALNKIIEATIDPDDINIYLEDILKNLSKQIAKELKDVSQIANLEGLYKGRKEGINYIYLTKRFFIKYLPDIDMKDFVNLLKEHNIDAEYGYAKIGNKTTRVCRIPENVFLDLIALRCGLTEIEDEQDESQQEEETRETATFEGEFIKMLEQFVYSEDKEMVYPSPSDNNTLLKIIEALESYFDINMDSAFIKIKKRETKYNVIEMLKDIKAKLLENLS